MRTKMMFAPCEQNSSPRARADYAATGSFSGPCTDPTLISSSSAMARTLLPWALAADLPTTSPLWALEQARRAAEEYAIINDLM